jgi:hypothetical protein
MQTMYYIGLDVHKRTISYCLKDGSVSYNKQRLHKAGYFRELLATNPDIDEGLCSLLRLCRETVVRLQKTESALIRSLERDSLLLDRVERLMTIPGVGPITALTWALEVGEVQHKEKQKGNANRATLAVARKLVAYLMAVDRGQRDFQVMEASHCAAA